MKHNKGPWVIIPSQEDNVEFKIIAQGDFMNIPQRAVAQVYKNNQHFGRSEANAKLIAAAPEMLEGLIKVYERWGVTYEGSPLHKEINEIIKKQQSNK